MARNLTSKKAQVTLHTIQNADLLKRLRRVVEAYKKDGATIGKVTQGAIIERALELGLREMEKSE